MDIFLLHPASWYSLPKGQGFFGIYMKPGHIYSLTHFNIDSSIQLIQLGKKLAPMLSFHIMIIDRTSQKQSQNSGTSSFVYPRLLRIFSKCLCEMKGVRRNGAPSKASTVFVNQNDRRSAPSTVDINTHIPIHCRNSPYVTSSSPSIFSLIISMIQSSSCFGNNPSKSWM